MPGAREAQPGFGNYFSEDFLVTPRVAHRSPMHLCKHNGHEPRVQVMGGSDSTRSHHLSEVSEF